MFLTDDELAILTGRKLKRLQIETLRRMGVPFLINACGKPVVTRSAVEGRGSPAPAEKTTWRPAVLQHAT